MSQNGQTVVSVPIYDFGVSELHAMSTDEGKTKTVESAFREARGRETARLHVTLKAISESDRRIVSAIEELNSLLQQRADQLNQLVAAFEGKTDTRFNAVHDDLKGRAEALSFAIQSFEGATEKRFSSVHDDARSRHEALSAQVSAFQQVEGEHHVALRSQVVALQQALWTQNDTNFNQSTTQARDNADRLAQDVRKLRDEFVSMLDARMNQSDASFAAMRGDLEVVKHLVMDLIKDRIGRTDPKAKPY